MNNTARRPNLSAGRPTAKEPMIVPINAVATVNPSIELVKPNTVVSASVVPEITAVSKPNSSPPKAAINVLLMIVVVSLPLGAGPGDVSGGELFKPVSFR
jgi:hypothetical protein